MFVLVLIRLDGKRATSDSKINELLSINFPKNSFHTRIERRAQQQQKSAPPSHALTINDVSTRFFPSSKHHCDRFQFDPGYH